MYLPSKSKALQHYQLSRDLFPFDSGERLQLSGSRWILKNLFTAKGLRANNTLVGCKYSLDDHLYMWVVNLSQWSIKFLSQTSHVFEPTCALCTVGSYASLSVCPSVCLSGLDQKSHWTIIHISKSISLSEEQINTCCVCKSQGGLTANIKLHFFSLDFIGFLDLIFGQSNFGCL